MKTTPVDRTDRDALHSWHRAGEVAHRHDRPDAPFWTEDEAVLMVTEDDPEERTYPFLTHTDDGVVAGAGLVFVPLLDNLDKAYVDLFVLPDHRGRGAGDSAVTHATEVARTEGRSLLIGEGWFPVDADDTHPVRAFASRHGFSLANTEVRRVLRLPVPVEQIRAWQAQAAAHHEGFEIVSYVDGVPEELHSSLVELLNQLAVDAPTGDIDFDAGQMTVDIYRQQVARLRKGGRTVLVSAAVKDGAVVAHSTLSIPPRGAELPHMSQWGTFVHRGHRGHRLGLAVKAANLRVVQERFPERTLIHTTNSPENGPMLAINEMMGFRRVEVLGEFMRTL